MDPLKQKIADFIKSNPELKSKTQEQIISIMLEKSEKTDNFDNSEDWKFNSPNVFYNLALV